MNQICENEKMDHLANRFFHDKHRIYQYLKVLEIFAIPWEVVKNH